MMVQWRERREDPDSLTTAERTMENNQIRTVPFKILLLQRLSIVTYFAVMECK